MQYTFLGVKDAINVTYDAALLISIKSLAFSFETTTLRLL